MEKKVGITIKQKEDESKALVISPKKLITFSVNICMRSCYADTHSFSQVASS